MKIRRFQFLSIVSVLLLSGCANNSALNTKPVTIDSNQPAWISNPYIGLSKDSIAAVGCARVHFKGVAAQKKLAISRAIDEIATEVKTTVNNVTLTKNVNGSSSIDSTSLQSANNVKLKTRVLGTYVDVNGNMCVRVVRVGL